MQCTIWTERLAGTASSFSNAWSRRRIFSINPHQMATTVLGVGTGVFVIAVVWIVTFGLWMILLRASGSSKLGVLPIFLLAVIITLVLVFFPQSPTTPSAFKEREIGDTLFIARYVLLALASVSFLIGLFMLLPFHFLEPSYAKVLRTHKKSSHWITSLTSTT
ncbi:transmembrane protein 218 [Festucalex cinctus]